MKDKYTIDKCAYCGGTVYREDAIIECNLAYHKECFQQADSLKKNNESKRKEKN